MPDDILATLNLMPADVPNLPASARTSLIAYLIRWEYLEAADRCLKQLLETHSHLVSVYDSLARLYLAQGQSGRALEMMRRRHGLRVSNSSMALEARAHLAAGDLAPAQAIAEQMTSEHPDLLTAWGLQAEVQLATGDLDGAEDAWRKGEMLSPGGAANALGMALVWQARGDVNKAILWAQTALARHERDGRKPSLPLLRLLEALFQTAGHDAQAEATAARIGRRQQEELETLQQALGPSLPYRRPEAPKPPTHTAQPQAGDEPAATAAAQTTQIPAPVSAEGVEVTPEENARLEQALHQYFAHEAFRPGQAEVITTLLRGDSVLAVMPTGAGKSLCYQLAALLLPDTTLVISPLIALMKDQIDGLPTEVARRSTAINSTLDGAQMETRLTRAAEGGYKLLYAAPERLRQRPFLHALKRAGISLLVVDEAHCVSLWGHDFRPDYRFIAKAWQELGEPPLLTMTATATPRVRDDIQNALGRRRLVATDIHRPNLKLESRRFANDAEKRRSLLAICRETKGSGIVYARSRRKCEELAEMLRHNSVSAIHYHAGLEDRAAAQERFMGDEVRVVVATIAFGMGVDKADVRFIVHYSPPKALENYYQEAGRAGRDGLPARCILFYTASDKSVLTRFNNQDALHVEFLRRVYAFVQQQIGTSKVGLLTIGDLERHLVADETDVRVAIHFLETAGLLWRGFDLPRTASLTLRHMPDGEDQNFARFVEKARLLLGQTVSRNLMDLSQEVAIDPRTIETRLLTWQDFGWLSYRGIGRDMLLSVPEPPADSHQRVAALLAQHRAGQDGRVAEIMAYATTAKCRHGHISLYFGGRPIKHCRACDNCLGERATPPQPARRRVSSQSSRITGDVTTILLHGVTELPFPMGRTGLARALQGSTRSTVQRDRFPSFGILANWTLKGIRQEIAQLEDQGLLTPFEKDGYRLLRLSPAGQDWLNAHPRDIAAVTATQPSKVAMETVPRSGHRSDDLSDYDRTLFERLRAWRLDQARQMGKPPFIILQDKVLKRIASSCPATEQDLAQIKGIGPRKLEQYASAVLDIVASLREDPSKEET